MGCCCYNFFFENDTVNYVNINSFYRWVVYCALVKLADAVKSHLNWRLWQALLHCWQDKWRVRSSVDVTMTSTFVSGLTAHCWHSLQLNQIVNNEAVLYRESLTATFSQNLHCFVLLLRGTCYMQGDFGSMSQQLVSVTFTGLTTLGFQVSLLE